MADRDDAGTTRRTADERAEGAANADGPANADGTAEAGGAAEAGGKDAAAPRRRGRPRSAASSAAGPGSPGEPKIAPENVTVIKKYANRRLYDTGASRYVTLEDLATMVREGRHFTVVDAKSGEDITRPVLGQIIFEQEAKDGPSLLPTEFLRQVISYYGDGMGAVVPSYLEASMRAFERGAEEMRAEMTRMTGEMTKGMTGAEAPDPTRMMERGMAGFAAPLKLIEEQTRRNQEAFGQALRMFSPFGAMGAGARATAKRDPGKAPAQPGASPTGEGGADELAELREQIAAMQRKVDGLG